MDNVKKTEIEIQERDKKFNQILRKNQFNFYSLDDKIYLRDGNTSTGRVYISKETLSLDYEKLEQKAL